jgi:L-2-hydroxyglutarate oxidase
LNDLGHYPAGVRAQAVSLNGKIIDDFLFIETKRCLHIGNAPSPAATSSIPIAKYIVNKININ